MTAPTGKERIPFIDVARFLGIFLVFYGHFVERIMYLGHPTAAAQYKWIYSFHMVLFVVLAGYVAGDKDLSLPFPAFVKRRAVSRLLPFAFFTVVFMVLAAFLPGEFFHLNLPSVEGYAAGIASTLFGIPLFCVPSWFLVLIFSVELVHYSAFRFLSSGARVAAAVLAFYGVGYAFNWRFDLLDPAEGRVVGWNYLFLHEAVVMYAFYLLGVRLGGKRFLQGTVSRLRLVPAALALFAVVLATAPLNRGRFSFPALDAVVILLSSHGHVFWFPFTALAGSLMVLCTARALPVRRTVAWLGGNTLILMCLNGVFYHFVNPPLARWAADRLSLTPPLLLLAATAVTVASLALCIPAVCLLNAWIPQLVGRPGREGPLLPRLLGKETIRE